MSNLAKNKNEKIFGIDFVFATISVALAFFGLAYVLSVLPGIQNQSSVCIIPSAIYGTLPGSAGECLLALGLLLTQYQFENNLEIPPKYRST